MTFNPVDDMENLQVNHIDGDKQNNSLSNLEWCTQSENQKHAFQNGLLSRKGERNPQCKLTEEQVLEISNLLIEREPVPDIADKYNVSKELIYAIKNKRLWYDLVKDFSFPKYTKRRNKE